jgi:S-adenosylmethionine:tRNA ribosyltransferase-isomerase
VTALAFELPPGLEASEPPQRRDDVKLLLASKGDGTLRHARFADLPRLLSAGDCLVVNVSATIPAALPGRRETGAPVRIHCSTRAPGLDQSWRVVEVRSADGSRPERGSRDERISLPGGAALKLVAPYLSGTRLWLASSDPPQPLEQYLAIHGEPIRYGYVSRRWPLGAYQNVYATSPGSVEMPSAGRPFTWELITELIARGVSVAPITLHAGLSSPERHEPPFPEPFEVPEATARLVSSVHAEGGRVIAVGTTVVRALESALRPDGSLGPAAGQTNLVIGPGRGVGVVDGLITGWHEPEASHLQMLEAIAGPELLTRSYDAALRHHYRWHEFGDSHLIL